MVKLLIVGNILIVSC